MTKQVTKHALNYAGAPLILEITDATLYRDDKPIATVQRRRVYAKGPLWRVYDTQGRPVMCFWTTPIKMAEMIARRITESTDA